MFVLASALQEVDFFDESFFMYVEDVDLSLKLSRLGDMYFVPDSVVMHYAHSTAKKGTTKEFRNPSSYNNPNLNFYLRHVICGYRYLVQKHNPLLKDKISFYAYFWMRWLKSALSYFVVGRRDSVIVVLKSLLKRRCL